MIFIVRRWGFSAADTTADLRGDGFAERILTGMLKMCACDLDNSVSHLHNSH